MTLTKGRIERTGRVVFHDASLAVWEEGIADARNAAGWEGAQRWDLVLPVSEPDHSGHHVDQTPSDEAIIPFIE